MNRLNIPVVLSALLIAACGNEETPVAEKAIESAIPEIFEDLNPVSDQHATAVYRKRIAAVLALRAINDAITEAKGNIL